MPPVTGPHAGAIMAVATGWLTPGYHRRARACPEKDGSFMPLAGAAAASRPAACEDGSQKNPPRQKNSLDGTMSFD
jgi:hypothetical protein